MNNKNFLENIIEGSTEFFAYKNKDKKKGPGSKEKGFPFYNPSMELNRDLSVVFLQWLVDNSKKSLKILDGLASSGIRGIRFANEINGNFEVFVNDWDEKAFNLIKKNIEKNNLENVEPLNNNLNSILSQEKFDYIDIDPFGSPVYFFDSALRSIKNNGVISCTATDTATLCGVYPKVCRRRYDAIPFHSVCMKEVGIRILLGCITRTASRYDKGILPLLSYTTDHYFRCYVRVFDSVSRANDSISKVGLVDSDEKIGFEKPNKSVGPLWMDKIHFKKMFRDIRPIVTDKKLGCKNNIWKLLELLEEEAVAPNFFYTTDSLSSFYKTSSPKKKVLFNLLEKEGYKIYNTHFEPTGFKTNASLEYLKKIFKK